MVDLDPNIWKNKDLGVSQLPFLDEVEAQAMEDYAARAEGRPARVVTHYPRKPEFMIGELTVPSNITQILYTEPPVIPVAKKTVAPSQETTK